MNERPEPFRVVLATNNAKKLTELRRIVAAATSASTTSASTTPAWTTPGEPSPAVEVLGLADVPGYPEPAETETTFAGNALLKARACVAATGLPALADDSGLCVDALNGMPGVRSARWAGPDATDAANNELVLRQLFDVPPERRGAQFVSAVALCLPDGSEVVRDGVMRGRLLTDLRGNGGFGYDPMFLAEGHAQSNGEISPAEKDAISHRGRALRAILPHLLAAAARSGSGTAAAGSEAPDTSPSPAGTGAAPSGGPFDRDDSPRTQA